MAPPVDAIALCGRDEPMSHLRSALADALAGRGRLAVVSGEAGIGKSAVAASIAIEAEAQGAAVTWGRAWEFADAPPYFPLWPCLRGLAINPTIEQGSREEDGSRAFHLWERVVAALAHASSEAPCIWILEDVHAADLGTLDLLTYLAQPLRAMRALVIVTARTRDPRVTERMSQRLVRMARDGLDLPLAPLPQGPAAALAAATLGAASSAAAVERITSLAGGNPLFLIECGKGYRAMGAERAAAALPPTVRQVAIDRVHLLPEATQRTLACGAVLGRELAASLVGRMLDALPARVIDDLLPALRADVVRELKPGTFAFSHALVRDAVYEHLGHEERARLHVKAEIALGALEATADTLVERARHALAGLDVGRAAVAADLVERATALLEHEGAFDRAHELHARAADARAAGALPALSPPSKLHVARIAHAAGRTDASRRLCDQIVAASRASGDAELLARAALLQGEDVRPGVRDVGQIELLEEAIALLGDRSPELSCRVLARLATAHQPAHDQAVPVAICREAIARARATGDDDALRYCLHQGSWAFCYAPAEERALPAAELLERALHAGDRPAALFARGWIAWCDGERGDHAAFDAQVDDMLTLSDEAGHPRHRWRALLFASGRAVTLGRFAESERFVTEVVMLGSLIDDFAMNLSLAVHQALRVLTQRRDDELAGHLAFDGVFGDDGEAAFMPAVFRCVAHARAGDVERTRAELAKLQLATWMRETTWRVSAHAVGFVGEACAFAGSDDERRLAREVLEAMPWTDLPADLISHVHAGSRVRVLGLLDAALGDADRAVERLREAHARAVERGHLPWVAQIAHELSRVFRAAGRGAEARLHLDEALRLARELEMPGLVRACLADGSSSTPTSAERSRIPSEPFVMERQGEVWILSSGAQRAMLKDSRGARLLARLVERPGEELHVLVLASDAALTFAESSAGEMLDERARNAYRARLIELEREIAATPAAGSNAKRIAQLEQERAALKGELARGVGLGGRPRLAGSATERARVSVQKRVREAIARVRESDENLGRLLERAVSTGTYCTFRP